MSATANDDAVNQVLDQTGVPRVNNSTEGIFVEFNAGTDPNLIAEARLDADLGVRGLWYHLAQIQNGEISYEGSIVNKINSLMDLYGSYYNKVSANADRLSKPSLYPNPTEIAWIKSELAKVKADPSYMPNFFGADVNPNVLFK